ncbi:MAG: ABC transporter permease [Syntrophotalea acetylenica]|jgi:molybdate transport system permease protein|uniref:Molybdenum ABC transporter permease n=1 Tax=Syntrophotalea acetylenica TaxID=29542 RepID=A0A1L3GH58_SYNAC|nr:ABC transporter permease [Syntrophotalea acetylenica]APG24998.1 molybdenum ABC transporter permease [Syntrophotalea acetylenica]APG43066.1 molybdenum ABC transporter permease [Syntrophotalea acetylenica]MDD4456527.1 ABC transporter permease [Syntrophotalea acetylenica]MDY0261016.1 ABC transporter permease [Syntrophotalea acetylenica]
MANRLFKAGLTSITVLFVGMLLWAMLSLVFMPRWAEVLSSTLSEEMLYSIRLSLITSGISVAVVMILAISIGYVLARFQFPGHQLLRTVVDLPMAFPELVLGLCLLLLFGHDPVAGWLKQAGIDIVFSKTGIAIAQIFTAAPYATRVVYAAFRSISPRYELVARSLGCGQWAAFWRVTLPMARGGLFAGAVIAFARCMGCFGTVLILAGGTRMFTETLPITLYLNISYGNLAMAMTSGILLILISLAAIVVFEMLNREVVL